MEIRHPANNLESTLSCHRTNNLNGIEFNLIDYRNNYFMSDDPKKMLQFYESFQNRDELIEWMMERPKGNYEIREFDGIKDIIVVIPTVDFDGKYARSCREEIFKGLHIVFVVSGKNNFYFNYAHNCNVGIKKAMEYNPKWIVVSNDDMYKIDEFSVLKQELINTDNKKYDIIFLKPHVNYSVPMYIGRKRLTYNILRFFVGRENGKLYRKYKLKYFYAAKNKLTPIFFSKVKGTDFINMQAFGIFSSNYVNSRPEALFDETYINEHEDLDISLQVFLEGRKYRIVDYNIGSYVGRTLGLGKDRGLRQVAGRVYFNWKFENIYLLRCLSRFEKKAS